MIAYWDDLPHAVQPDPLLASYRCPNCGSPADTPGACPECGYRTDTLDVDQRLKITSLTFLFTDLKGSTELYQRVGDLAAFELVRAHLHIDRSVLANIPTRKTPLVPA